jgi:hypothetical protein
VALLAGKYRLAQGSDHNIYGWNYTEARASKEETDGQSSTPHGLGPSNVTSTSWWRFTNYCDSSAHQTEGRLQGNNQVRAQRVILLEKICHYYFYVKGVSNASSSYMLRTEARSAFRTKKWRSIYLGTISIGLSLDAKSVIRCWVFAFGKLYQFLIGVS